MLRSLISLVILKGAILAIVACGGGEEPSPTAVSTSPSPPPARPQATAAIVAEDNETKKSEGSAASGREITIVNMDPGGGGGYTFEPADLEVAVGETVTLKLIAKTELHSFTIDALNIDHDIDGSQERDKVEVVTHTFDTPGKYDIVCIYHEGSGMVGTLTVK